MDENPKVLDFVKAVSDADRLRIIGLLARRAATMREVATQLDMPFREAFGHLGMLEFAGVVRKNGEMFSLDDEAVQNLSKRQFSEQRESYVPAPDLDATARKVLTSFLNADGSLKQVPLQGPKLRVILNYLVAVFEPGADYTEKEVNTLLRRFHSDPVTLRRALIDAGLLSRESNGSRYWKTEQRSETDSHG
jgi:hypothetical protein